MSKRKSEVSKKNTVVLLDSHALLHRAFHAIPGLKSPSGEPTGALYGFVTMLLSIIETFKPDYVIATFDLPEKTFRHLAYKEYKGTRGETDPELVIQLQTAHHLCDAFSIPKYLLGGFEADDMLGTLAEQFKKKDNTEVIIASGDMDTLQLVDKDVVKVYTLKKGIKDTVVYNEQAVFDRFGFPPSMLVDYKGLRGDPSDNIPGIPGIGDVTAKKIIQNFGTLEQVYEILENNREEIVSVLKERFTKKLEDHKEDAMFSKVLATIRIDAPIVGIIPEKPWLDVLDPQVLISHFQELGFRSLLPRVKRIFKIQDLEQESLFAEKKQKEEVPAEELSQMQVMYWLLHSDTTNPTLDDILGGMGVRSAGEAKELLEKKLRGEKLFDLYEKIEKPLIPILSEMKERGVCIDVDHFKVLSEKYTKKTKKLEKEICALAGREFNVRSPKQLAEVLFDELEISPKGLKKTAGGSRSTRESELIKLLDLHPIIQKILDYREFHKLVSTYIDAIPKLVGEDGKIHADFIQTGTSTGRFSSANPNLQNIPVRHEAGKEIRNGFMASPGFTLVATDYSQVELRVAAILSGDPYMVKVFQEGRDIHAAVAAKVNGVSEGEVTSEMRRQAKVINFGVLYGMGIKALQMNLACEYKEAQTFYKQYFEEFPTIQEYLEDVKKEATEKGYTETLFGRRRYFPNLSSHIPYIKAQAERMAINAPIQGTATADIIKLALVHVDEEIKKRGWGGSVFVLMQIHDELVFEIKEGMTDEVVPVLSEIMEDILKKSYLRYESSVPLKVQSSVKKRWGDMK